MKLKMKFKSKPVKKRGKTKLKPPNSVKTKEAETLFERVAIEMLHEQRDLFDTLSTSEKQLVLQWMMEAMTEEEPYNAVHDVLWEVDYVRKPVDVETFVRDEYYMGKVFTDEHGHFSLYDPWLEDLKEVHRPGSQIVEWLMTGSIGIGKGHPVTEKVATPNGWREVGSCEVGDYVIGSDGSPVRIIGVYPRGRMRVYRVTLTDGATVVVDGDHLWAVNSPSGKQIGKAWRVKTTKELIGKLKTKRGQRRWHTPVISSPVQYATVELPLAPYTLGALLGDGCMTDNSLLFSTTDQDILTRVQDETGMGAHYRGGCDYCLTNGREGGAPNPLIEVLRELNLWGKYAQEKFVPKAYLTADIDSRLSLLQGLLDTDGWHMSAIRHTEFSSSSLQLAEDVAALVRSLGGVARVRPPKETKGLDAHCVTINMPMNPFYVKRKACHWTPHEKYKPARMLDSIEPLGYADVVCLAVDSKDSLYVTRDYIVTHNTSVAMASMAYKLYCLSCLRNPASFYSLMPGSLIVFGLFSATKRLVADTGYFKLRGYIDASPYFREKFPRSTKIDSKCDFSPTTGKNVQIISGCLVEGTRVFTPYGEVPIELLTDTSAHILGQQNADTMSLAWAPYEGVICTGSKKCLDLATESGETITCSEDHKVMVYDDEFQTGTCKKASELREGENLLVLQEDAALDQILRECSRRLPTPMQGMCATKERRALPQNEGMQGQSASSFDRPQTMFDLWGDEKTRIIRKTEGEAGFWYSDLLEVVLQGLRGSGGEGVCGKPGGESVGEGVQVTVQCAGDKPGSMQALLQGESEKDFEEVIFTPCTVTCEQKTQTVVFREQGSEREAVARVSRVGAEASREATGEGEKIQSVGEGDISAPCSRSPESSKETRVTGYLYIEGCKVCDGILQGCVRLLWDTPVIYKSDLRPRNTSLQGRPDNTGEHGTLLPEVQQQQKWLRPVRVVAQVQHFGYPNNSKDTPRLRASRLVSIKPVGLKKTYDVFNAQTSNHSLVANRILSSNSQGFHALGQDVFSFGIDEVNFMREKKDKEKAKAQMVGQAYDIFNTVSTRLRSRFMRQGGSIPGIMILMSSRNSQTSFLEAKLSLAKTDPNVFVSDYALWDVHPKHRYCGKTFRVEVGDKISQSRVLGPKDKPRANVKVIHVPTEYKRPFLEDTDQALRDVAGVATFNLSPFIRDRKSIHEAIRPSLTHPFTRSEIVLDYMDDIMLSEFFEVKTFCRKENSVWKPRVNPSAPRFIHVDLALSGDCAGFAMGHVSGMVRHHKFTFEGIEEETCDPFIIMDILLRIVPPPGSQIDLSKIRAFILFLRRCGVPLTRVSFDGFQSADSIQILKKQKVDVVPLSVDKTANPYTSLRSAHFDRRIATYEYEPYIEEMLDLEFDVKKQKVDHPIKASKGGKGSKDVSDAAAGVAWHCISDERARKGAPIFTMEELQRRIKVIDPTSAVLQTHEEERMTKRRISGHDVNWKKLKENVDA